MSAKIEVGKTVRFRVQGQRVFGVVRTEATITPTGPVVSVQLLPDFAHLLPTGWTDANVLDLTEVRVCACAHLAYQPTWGDRKGQTFTTGCDFGRMPSRNSKFLPGHDAKAKGFLIKAAGWAPTLTNGLSALEQAREYSHAITMHVAAGIDNGRKADQKRARSKRRIDIRPDAAPAQREDTMDEIAKLQKKLGVTDPMIKALAYAITERLHEFAGQVSSGTPTGTRVAMQRRGLITVVDGRVTDLGYKIMRQPTLAETNPELIVCKDEHGAYAGHSMKWDEAEFIRQCRRCGHADEDN
ncbi:hypothetical protein SEA_KEANU_108 [Streptomyces phage Keanu]|nr:hypothetical protein SEA_KEANU_108 [Streptomyces phage Keanu]